MFPTHVPFVPTPSSDCGNRETQSWCGLAGNVPMFPLFPSFLHHTCMCACANNKKCGSSSTPFSGWPCLGLEVSLPSSAVASRARAPQGRRLCRRGRRTQAHKPSRSLCVSFRPLIFAFGVTWNENKQGEAGQVWRDISLHTLTGMHDKAGRQRRGGYCQPSR